MKYLLRKNEERCTCVVCKKSFIRKKGSKAKTCSKRCASKLREINKLKKGEEK